MEPSKAVKEYKEELVKSQNYIYRVRTGHGILEKSWIFIL
jgi:hypothetical protein